MTKQAFRTVDVDGAEGLLGHDRSLFSGDQWVVKAALEAENADLRAALTTH